MKFIKLRLLAGTILPVLVLADAAFAYPVTQPAPAGWQMAQAGPEAGPPGARRERPLGAAPAAQAPAARPPAAARPEAAPLRPAAPA
ncbi:hypothetical protein PY365_21145, partial [Roseiarcaceae bacterium H3SJ34-1]|uniref:hypothetical protein n=1 Tax=Terripilifer ovatus TaxID=3032367 RepID=UPI003AB97FEE|nr:hypothetical protein [Roseiarcaceae bacterium H3SJ34-1]